MTNVSKPIVYPDTVYAIKCAGYTDQKSPAYFGTKEELFTNVTEGEEVYVYNLVGVYRARRRVDLEKEE